MDNMRRTYMYGWLFPYSSARGLLTIVIMTMWLCAGTVAVLAQDLESAQMSREPRTVVVARDGSGQYTSIQEAVDDAKSGDTIRIKAGEYQEDVTIHSKDRLRLIGDGVDDVTVLGGYAPGSKDRTAVRK